MRALPGGEHEAGLVAELPGEVGRRDVLGRLDADVDGELLARRELAPLLSAGADEPALDDARVSGSVLAEAGATLVRIALLRQQPVVLRDRLARRAVERDLAVAQQHRPPAEAVDGRGVVGDEDDRAAALLELEDLPEALALELLVADGEHLVEQQHVDVEVRGDREAEPHVHARRVRPHGHVDEPLELREGDDLVHVPPDRLALQAEDGAVEVDVLAARELGVEAGAELEQRADAALPR